MRHADQVYLEAVKKVVEHGTLKETRMPGVTTRSYTGLQMRFDMTLGFPLIESKRVPYRLVCVELAWFLSGRTNVQWLQARKCRIWNDDAAKSKERNFNYGEGELGPIYGHQWRCFDSMDGKDGTDQIDDLINDIKAQPTSRRLIVTAWNPADIDRMVLPPCHMIWQILCNPLTKTMDLCLTMRSGDMGLGLPFNIASYASILQMIASECGYKPGELIININDAHLYTDHIAPIMERFEHVCDDGDGHDPSQESITVDLPKSWREFVLDFETDLNHKVSVNNYNPMPTLKLKLHT